MSTYHAPECSGEPSCTCELEIESLRVEPAHILAAQRDDLVQQIEGVAAHIEAQALRWDPEVAASLRVCAKRLRLGAEALTAAIARRLAAYEAGGEAPA